MLIPVNMLKNCRPEREKRERVRRDKKRNKDREESERECGRKEGDKRKREVIERKRDRCSSSLIEKEINTDAADPLKIIHQDVRSIRNCSIIRVKDSDLRARRLCPVFIPATLMAEGKHILKYYRKMQHVI